MKSFLTYLTEDSVTNEYGRFQNDISLEEFTTIVGADPTAKDGYTGAYTKWLVKQYLKLNSDYRRRFAEDAYKYRDTLAKFDLLRRKNKITDTNNKDINRFGYRELENFVAEFPDDAFKLKSVEKKEYDTVYDDGKGYNRWRILIPRTMEAAQHIGAGTRWCTAARGEDNYFDTYYKDDDPFYCIVNDDFAADNRMKWQFQASSRQFMNWLDDYDFAGIIHMPDAVVDFVRSEWPNFPLTKDMMNHGVVYSFDADYIYDQLSEQQLPNASEALTHRYEKKLQDGYTTDDVDRILDYYASNDRDIYKQIVDRVEASVGGKIRSYDLTKTIYDRNLDVKLFNDAFRIATVDYDSLYETQLRLETMTSDAGYEVVGGYVNIRLYADELTTNPDDYGRSSELYLTSHGEVELREDADFDVDRYVITENFIDIEPITSFDTELFVTTGRFS